MKKLYLSRERLMHEGCSVNFPTRIRNLEASLVHWKESGGRVQLPFTRQRQTIRTRAVEDLVLSQKDKPNMCRSAREISHETGIPDQVCTR